MSAESSAAVRPRDSTKTFNRGELLAYALWSKLAGSADGHCVRVNHLAKQDTRDARAALVALHTRDGLNHLDVHILSNSGFDHADTRLHGDISPDQAVEFRNRKKGVFCLFVPAGQHSSTVSSLGNSFAEIDGRDLIDLALAEAKRRLPRDVAHIISDVQSAFSAAAVIRPTSSDLFDFAVEASRRVNEGTVQHLGLEMWRVGLIADGGGDFVQRVPRNRRTVVKLSRPKRIAASLEDRVATVGLLPDSASQVRSALRAARLSDVRAWSRALSDGGGPTFDQWKTPEEAEPTNCTGVRVAPFLNEEGELIKGAKGLRQPQGIGSLPHAIVGEKSVLNVKWETEPTKTANVGGWLIALEPVDLERTGLDELVDLPSVEKKGSLRTLGLKLDMSFETWPQYPFHVRVTGLDSAGNELASAANEAIEGFSQEFLLSGEEGDALSATTRRRTVSTLAEGYLRAVIEADADLGNLPVPVWNITDNSVTCSVRATSRYTIVLAFSRLLYDLQDNILKKSDSLGHFRLNSDEPVLADLDAIEGATFPASDLSEERSFRNARTKLFRAIREAAGERAIVETAVWNSELVGLVVRYARAYLAWLDAVPGDQLGVALGVDTLSIRIGDHHEAAVVLPTHPLRVLWFAGHATLLRGWAELLADRKKNTRKHAVDLDTVAQLEALNCPAFAFPADANQPYVFFRNLDPGHGVAMPAETVDPGSLLTDIGQMLGTDELDDVIDGRRPARLAEYLESFTETHPYADPLDLALINPGDGQILAGAFNAWERIRNSRANASNDPDEEEVIAEVPGICITAYPLDSTGQSGITDTRLTALDRRRRREEERPTRKANDHLQPALGIRVVGNYGRTSPEIALSHHVAVVQDITRPRPLAVDALNVPAASYGFSLHGLVARFQPRFDADESSARWIYRIDDEGKVRPHPSEKNLAETLADLHRAVARGFGRFLKHHQNQLSSVNDEESGSDHHVAALVVNLDPGVIDLVERFHEGADWVLTVDRFFGIDYFDSPDAPYLAPLSRKYVLDAAPEFHDGLGHRMIVTTSSRDEVADILRRQMDEFGLSTIDESVGQILHLLKMVSGRLVLDALRGDSRAAAAVALASVVSSLQNQGRLRSSIVVPVDSHIDLLEPGSAASSDSARRRCDLLLIGPTKSGLDATLIEVKWRSSLSNGEADALADDMAAQMRATADVLEQRYFNDERIDGALQRSGLAHVLRFYLARAMRFGLIEQDRATALETLLTNLDLDKTTLVTRNEGFIIVLGKVPDRRKIVVDERTMVHILTVPEIASAGTLSTGDRLEPNSVRHGTVCQAQPGIEADAQLAGDKGRTRSEPSSGNVSHFTVAAQSHRGDDGPATGHSVSTSTVGDSPEQSESEQASLDTSPGTDLAPPQDIESTSHNSQVETSSPVIEPAIGDQNVVLGDTLGGEAVTWKPRVAGSPHLFILGIPGQGKSKSIERILTELASTATPALVFDFHGPFMDPHGPYAKRARPHLLDAAKGLPFSPFSCDPRGSVLEVQQHAQSVAEILRHVFKLGDIQQDVIYTTLRDLYFRNGYSDVDDDHPLPSPPTVKDLAKALERKEKDNVARNVVARCRSFFDFDLFSADVDSSAEFGELIMHGTVVGLHRLGGEELAFALSAFLLRRIYVDMISWGPTDRIRLAIVLDEAHRLANDVTLPKLMKEGRKYGIAIVVASQGLADFHPDIVGNAGTKVSFRVNNPDSRKVAAFFQGGTDDLVSKLEQLQVGEAIVQTPEMKRSMRVKMRLPNS